MWTFNRSELQPHLDEGHIREVVHPKGALKLYNYTAKCQYESAWTPVTKACRGLVVDSSDTVIARPFPKFFNLEQHNPEDLPDEPFKVFDKLDGSLGVLYKHRGVPYLATRGSFTSPQSEIGTQMLREQLGDTDPFDDALTYLFEIIYPENRIVVDYGAERKLVLLAVRETATGHELNLDDFAQLGFPLAEHFDGVNDYGALRNVQRDDSEGFVILFESGLRVKVKLEEYVRLHRLVTGLNPKHIWEMLKEGEPLERVLERVPDEFYAWVKEVEADLNAQYKGIERVAQEEYKDDFASRKEAAAYFKTCTYPGILFRMMDDKPYDEVIWKLIKPKGDETFKVDEV